MKHEDTPTTVREFEEFAEEVSNWYVRVNRRRFWRAARRRWTRSRAHSSLFVALRAATLVLAPIVPFVTEALWQQVIRKFSPEGAETPESVHHALWPETLAAWRDEELLEATRSVRAVISTALRLREEAKLRVRQPLPSVTIVAGAETRAALAAQQETIATELNVKRVEFAEDLSALEEDHLALDFRRAGPVLRNQLAATNSEIEELSDEDRADAIESIRSGRSVRLPGWTEDLPPEIFTFERHPAHGVKTAETQSGIVIALDTRLDDALIHEGWARDIIRNVQTLRREAGLEVSDRIHLGAPDRRHRTARRGARPTSRPSRRRSSRPTSRSTALPDAARHSRVQARGGNGRRRRRPRVDRASAEPVGGVVEQVAADGEAALERLARHLFAAADAEQRDASGGRRCAACAPARRSRDGNESVADTSSGSSGPPMPASSVASTSRSGPCGSGGSAHVKLSGKWNSSSGSSSSCEVDDRVLEAEQHARVDLEREVEVDRTLAALLGMQVDLPRLAQRVALDEVPLVVHVEAVLDRVVLQVGDEARDVENCHLRRPPAYRTLAAARFATCVDRIAALRRARPGSAKNAWIMPS